MIKVSNKSVILLAIIGGLTVSINLGINAELKVVIWHGAQYLIVAAIIAPLWEQPCMMAGGIILMLIVDTWLIVEMHFGLNSAVTMLFSVLSAFKLLAIFPIGVFWGYFFSVKYPICIQKNTT